MLTIFFNLKTFCSHIKTNDLFILDSEVDLCLKVMSHFLLYGFSGKRLLEVNGQEVTPFDQSVKGCDSGHNSGQEVRELKTSTHYKATELWQEDCGDSCWMGHLGTTNFSKTLPCDKKLIRSDLVWQPSCMLTSDCDHHFY